MFVSHLKLLLQSHRIIALDQDFVQPVVAQPAARASGHSFLVMAPAMAVREWEDADREQVEHGLERKRHEPRYRVHHVPPQRLRPIARGPAPTAAPCAPSVVITASS